MTLNLNYVNVAKYSSKSVGEDFNRSNIGKTTNGWYFEIELCIDNVNIVYTFILFKEILAHVSQI